MQLGREDLDFRFANVLLRAAARSAPAPEDKSFLERRLEEALVQELAKEFAPKKIVAKKKLVGVELPDWDPQPGWIDVAVLEEESPWLTIELKIDDIDQTLWDIYKMASARRLSSVAASYVVAAASIRTWTSELDCVGLFSRERADADWYSEFLFEKYRRAWVHLLKGGAARPIRVPEQIRLTFVASSSLAAYPGYEVRALGVAMGPSDRWLDFEDGWPITSSHGARCIDPLP